MNLTDIAVKSIHVENLNPTDCFTPLQKALLQTGMKILDEQGVQAYKAEVLDTHRKLNRTLKLRMLLTALVGYAIALSVTFLPAVKAIGELGMILAIPVAALGAALGTSGLISMCNVQPGDPLYLGWESAKVGWCDGNVYVTKEEIRAGFTTIALPDLVENIIQTLSDTGVTAGFTVEYFLEDPFLKVSDGLESYYLWAWNEKEYIPQ